MECEGQVVDSGRDDLAADGQALSRNPSTFPENADSRVLLVLAVKYEGNDQFSTNPSSLFNRTSRSSSSSRRSIITGGLTEWAGIRRRVSAISPSSCCSRRFIPSISAVKIPILRQAVFHLLGYATILSDRPGLVRSSSLHGQGRFVFQPDKMHCCPFCRSG